MELNSNTNTPKKDQQMFNANFVNQNNSSKDIFLQQSRQAKRSFAIPPMHVSQQPLMPQTNNVLPPLNYPRMINNPQFPAYNNRSFYVPKLTSPEEYINQKTQEYINNHPDAVNTIFYEQKKNSLDLKNITLNQDTPRDIPRKQSDPSEKLIPIECPICHKTFNRLSSYTNHKNLHTGERPYRCKTCGKTFNASPNLSRHKKIHKRTK